MKARTLALLACLVSASNPAASQTERFTTSTGVRAVVRTEADTEVVAVGIFIKAGIADEGNAPGVGALVAHALMEGNENQSTEEVARFIQRTGSALTVTWRPDYTLISCVTSRAGFDDALYAISQSLKGAKLEPDSIERARAALRAEVEQEQKEPYRLAYGSLRQRMYRTSPYRERFGGSLEAIRRLTPAAARQFYLRLYTPENTLVAVAGGIPVSHVRATLQNYFEDYSRPSSREVEPPLKEELQESARIQRFSPTHTAMILTGFPGPGLVDPEYPAFAVLAAALGGGKSSRLWRKVRDGAGLGYVIGAQVPDLVRQSHLIAHIELDPARSDAQGTPVDLAAVEQLFLETVRSPLATPLTDAEVERAKKLVIGAHALTHQRARDRAFLLGLYELIGLGWEFDSAFPERVAALTTAQVQRAAEKHLQNGVTVVLLPGR